MKNEFRYFILKDLDNVCVRIRDNKIFLDRYVMFAGYSYLSFNENSGSLEQEPEFDMNPDEFDKGLHFYNEVSEEEFDNLITPLRALKELINGR